MDKLSTSYESTIRLSRHDKMKNDDTIGTIMKTARAISNLLRTVTEGALLTLSFVIGIGITSVIVKLLGASPMKNNQQESTWENPSGSAKESVMF